MNIKGIRISDLKNGKCIPLFELLRDIPEPNQFNWSLLWFDVTAVDKEGEFIFEQRETIFVQNAAPLILFPDASG
jgi:hypothetical protein